MPIVRVEMWPGRTKDREGGTSSPYHGAIVTVAKTTPEATIVIFEDVSKENWAVGGARLRDRQVILYQLVLDWTCFSV